MKATHSRAALEKFLLDKYPTMDLLVKQASYRDLLLTAKELRSDLSVPLRLYLS